ncbi:MAG: response regulator, partial [Bdellovibrionales bacterium]|nr:response regulator [Bdellovibrionales bacterium]
LMGGELCADSEAGVGSVFHFSMELGVNLAPEVRHGDGSIPGESPQDTPENSLRILVVEDNLVNQRLAEIMLTKLGHSSVIAGDGRQALQQIQEGSFDLILMDCRMPVLDGYDTTREIRKNSGDVGKIPIIAMTANAMEGDSEQCFAAGMDDYLTKPINKRSLGAMLQKYSSKLQ